MNKSKVIRLSGDMLDEIDVIIEYYKSLYNMNIDVAIALRIAINRECEYCKQNLSTL